MALVSCFTGGCLVMPHSNLVTHARWRRKYIVHYEDMAYVNYNKEGFCQPKDAVTVSEAIGYGLLVSVLANHRQDFDRLLRFYDRHCNKNGLMAWQQVLRGGKVFTNPDAGGCNSATDGDLDAAYALLLAASHWAEPAYKQRGLAVCKALYKKCINHETNVVTLGDWVVSTDEKYWYVSRPSDYMLTHFLLFAQEDTERAGQWRAVFEASIACLQAQLALHPATGLVADFVLYDREARQHQPVVGQVLERECDGECSYNACRLPWRMAVYYQATHDARVLPLLQALTAFFTRSGALSAGYTLEGEPHKSTSDICFMAPVWCLYKVMNSPAAEDMAERLEDLPDKERVYYGETIELLCALQMAYFSGRGAHKPEPLPVTC